MYRNFLKSKKKHKKFVITKKYSKSINLHQFSLREFLSLFPRHYKYRYFRKLKLYPILKKQKRF